MTHLCKLQDMLIWNGLFEPDGFSDYFLVGWRNKVEHSCCLQRVRNVDYLLLAKLVAISTLGNPPWLGEQMYFCFASRR
jgi:hypothetical protein